MGGRTSQLKGKRFELSIANKLKEVFNIKVRRTLSHYHSIFVVDIRE